MSNEFHSAVMVTEEKYPSTQSGTVAYVCPACYGRLEQQGQHLICMQCHASYTMLDTAYADFATDISFEDWWAQSPELLNRWMTEYAPKEEEYQVGLARNYVVPLLRKLGYQSGQATLLSAACGLAADIDFLNDAGYATWGIDCGNRVQRWSARRYREQLGRADLFALPFPDRSFDMVMCFNVIEHIGTVGDTTTVTPDYQQQRREAIRSLLRVTKPGGYVLLSGVNRWFPLDFFHLQESRLVRFHSPWEPFSLSWRDYECLARDTGLAAWTRPLPLRGFFSWTNLRHRPLIRPLLPLADWMLGSLPAQVYGSFVSFFTVVLIQRRFDAEDQAQNSVQNI